MYLNNIRFVELRLFKNNVITTKTMTKLTTMLTTVTLFLHVLRCRQRDQHPRYENKYCNKNMESYNVTQYLQ